MTNAVKSFCLQPVTVKQDAFIEDHSDNDGRHYDILEIKCPYSARKMTPEAACHEITNFAVVRAMDILAAAGPQLLISDTGSVSHYTDAMVRFCCINTMWYFC